MTYLEEVCNRVGVQVSGTNWEITGCIKKLCGELRRFLSTIFIGDTAFHEHEQVIVASHIDETGLDFLFFSFFVFLT